MITSRGGGGWAPPPLEIEKQKKKVNGANIKLFHLYFATFLVENVIFSAIFGAGPPPLKNGKAKKKRLSDFGPPLLRIPGHAPDFPSPILSVPF